MDRRDFLKNVATGVAAAATVGKLGTLAREAHAQEKAVVPKARVNTGAALQKGTLETITFREKTFQVSAAQKAAYAQLPADLQERMQPHEAGKTQLTATQIQELRQFNDLADKFSEKRASTIMCPW
jgi:hypothetical protein